ncbi:MAG: tetratricopeptide repeat protein, partial [bacterium]|nr:tetratricopeptide repeat protein [bacterium]
MEEAKTLLLRAIEKQPALTQAHMLLGIISARQQQWDAAVVSFSNVTKLDPDNSFAHYYLGQAHRARGNREAAAQSLATALETGFPRREQLTIELAIALNEKGKPREALARLAKVSEPGDQEQAGQYHAAKAVAHRLLDEAKPALEEIELAVERHRHNAAYWGLSIETFIAAGQHSLALTAAIAAQRLFPDHPDILYQFGVASHYVQQSPFTKLALRRLRDSRPNDRRIRVREGLAARKVGQADEAAAALREAAANGVVEAHLFLGALLLEREDFPAAEVSL